MCAGNGDDRAAVTRSFIPANKRLGLSPASRHKIEFVCVKGRETVRCAYVGRGVLITGVSTATSLRQALINLSGRVGAEAGATARAGTGDAPLVRLEEDEGWG